MSFWFVLLLECIDIIVGYLMKSKKFLCTLLAIMFVFASIPFTAFAQSSNDIVENDALYEELLSTNQL